MGGATARLRSGPDQPPANSTIAAPRSTACAFFARCARRTCGISIRGPSRNHVRQRLERGRRDDRIVGGPRDHRGDPHRCQVPPVFGEIKAPPRRASPVRVRDRWVAGEPRSVQTLGNRAPSAAHGQAQQPGEHLQRPARRVGGARGRDTAACTRSGSWAAMCATTAPPAECPTRVTGGRSSSATTARTVPARSAMDIPSNSWRTACHPAGRSDHPDPLRGELWSQPAIVPPAARQPRNGHDRDGPHLVGVADLSLRARSAAAADH